MSKLETHRDPFWWRRGLVTTGNAPYDLCDGCGHVRFMHGELGCTAPSTALINKPDPCGCGEKRQTGVWHETRGIWRGT